MIKHEMDCRAKEHALKMECLRQQHDMKMKILKLKLAKANKENLA